MEPEDKGNRRDNHSRMLQMLTASKIHVGRLCRLRRDAEHRLVVLRQQLHGGDLTSQPETHAPQSTHRTVAIESAIQECIDEVAVLTSLASGIGSIVHKLERAYDLLRLETTADDALRAVAELLDAEKLLAVAVTIRASGTPPCTIDWDALASEVATRADAEYRKPHSWMPVWPLVDGDGLQAAVQSHQRVVVQFWAQWNYSFRVHNETLAQVSRGLSDSIYFCALDVGEQGNREWLERCQVPIEFQEIPVFAAFADGAVQGIVYGASAPAELERQCRRWFP